MKSFAWLFLGLLAAGITWLSTRHTPEAWSYSADVKEQMGDLYSPWVGSRELLLHHRNPYGPEVSRQIQMAFYGHVIDQSYDSTGKSLVNEQRFAYPVYVVFLLAAAVHSDFVAVREWARVILAGLTAISILLCLDIVHWRLTRAMSAALILFILSSPQLVQGLRLEQLALVVGFLLIAAAWCTQKNYLAVAGALLALTTIKPQMSIMPLCWFAIWAAGDWIKRWRIAAAFVVTLAALIAGGEVILPGWIGYFVQGLSAYRKYSPTSSLLLVVLGDTFGKIVAATFFVALLIIAWRNRRSSASSPEFTLMFAVFLMGTILVFPLLIPFNQVMLILPTVLLLRDWTALSRFSRLIFITLVSWTWITDLVLLLSSARLPFRSRLSYFASLIASFFPLFLPLLNMAKRREAPAKAAPTDLQPTLSS